jgi:nucleoside-diphosphate-sugar epimerase
MKILITGGAGFLGLRLAKRILERGTLAGPDGKPQSVTQVVLADVVKSALDDPRVTSLMGDIADPSFIDAALGTETASVFHLAAVVSGQAEADFALGMRVNLDATRLLLEACRKLAHPPRFVFTSSVAVFGGPLPSPVPETWILNPQNSYGTQKAIGELLVNDYSRKGFVDGRALRLPTISVRPGRPNKAASSFASGIIREPLAGEIATCPVPPGTPMWLSSPRTVIGHLIEAHDAPAAAYGTSRSLNLPGLTVTAGEMVATLERVAGQEVASRVRWEEDAAVAAIVTRWPARLETVRAEAMGMKAETDFDSIVRAYIAGE